MNLRCLFTAFVIATLAVAGFPALAQNSATQSAPAAATPPPDPWPRVVDLKNGQVLVYQPQVNKWEGNRIDFRCALAIKPTGATNESFAVVFATARTQVDRVRSS